MEPELQTEAQIIVSRIDGKKALKTESHLFGSTLNDNPGGLCSGNLRNEQPSKE